MNGERGVGLLRPEADQTDGAAIVQAAMALQPEGLLLNSPRPDLLRFMPALNVTAAEVDHMLLLLDTAIQTVRS